MGNEVLKHCCTPQEDAPSLNLENPKNERYDTQFNNEDELIRRKLQFNKIKDGKNPFIKQEYNFNYDDNDIIQRNVHNVNEPTGEIIQTKKRDPAEYFQNDFTEDFDEKNPGNIRDNQRRGRFNRTEEEPTNSNIPQTEEANSYYNYGKNKNNLRPIQVHKSNKPSIKLDIYESDQPNIQSPKNLIGTKYMNGVFSADRPSKAGFQYEGSLMKSSFLSAGKERSKGSLPKVNKSNHIRSASKVKLNPRFNSTGKDKLTNSQLTGINGRRRYYQAD